MAVGMDVPRVRSPCSGRSIHISGEASAQRIGASRIADSAGQAYEVR